MRKAAGAAFLVAIFLPLQSSAMTVEQFDKMAADDQRHYVMFLVNEAQKLLRGQGHPELARNIDRLFGEIPPGEQRSLGESQFEKSLAGARRQKIRFSLWHAPTSEIQWVLCDTLFQLGIKPAPAFFSRFGELTRNRAFFQKELADRK